MSFLGTVTGGVLGDDGGGALGSFTRSLADTIGLHGWKATGLGQGSPWQGTPFGNWIPGINVGKDYARRTPWFREGLPIAAGIAGSVVGSMIGMPWLGAVTGPAVGGLETMELGGNRKDYLNRGLGGLSGAAIGYSGMNAYNSLTAPSMAEAGAGMAPAATAGEGATTAGTSGGGAGAALGSGDVAASGAAGSSAGGVGAAGTSSPGYIGDMYVGGGGVSTPGYIGNMPMGTETVLPEAGTAGGLGSGSNIAVNYPQGPGYQAPTSSQYAQIGASYPQPGATPYVSDMTTSPTSGSPTASSGPATRKPGGLMDSATLRNMMLLKTGLGAYQNIQQQQAAKGGMSAQQDAIARYNAAIEHPYNFYKSDPGALATRQQQMADLEARYRAGYGGTEGGAFARDLIREGSATDQQLLQQYLANNAGLGQMTQPYVGYTMGAGGTTGGAVAGAAQQGLQDYAFYQWLNS